MSAAEPVGPPAPVGRRVRLPKMAELVAAQLRRQIVRGELVEGAALPPEKVLMRQFSVSRPTLREAYRILEAESLIVVRLGAQGGARVRPPSLEVAARYAGLILQHSGTTAQDVLMARLLVEPQAVALLARRRSQEDVTRLGEAVGGRPEAFHSLLIELTGNRTLQVLMGMLNHLLDLTNLVQEAAADRGVGTEFVREARTSRRRLVELIAAGDAAGAESLWRGYISGAREHIVDGRPAMPLDLLD